MQQMHRRASCLGRPTQARRSLLLTTQLSSVCLHHAAKRCLLRPRHTANRCLLRPRHTVKRCLQLPRHTAKRCLQLPGGTPPPTTTRRAPSTPSLLHACMALCAGTVTAGTAASFYVQLRDSTGTNTTGTDASLTVACLTDSSAPSGANWCMVRAGKAALLHACLPAARLAACCDCCNCKANRCLPACLLPGC